MGGFGDHEHHMKLLMTCVYVYVIALSAAAVLEQSCHSCVPLSRATLHCGRGRCVAIAAKATLSWRAQRRTSVRDSGRGRSWQA